MGSLQKTSPKAFPAGIHVPSLTWFLDDADQSIDWVVQKKHLQFLISSGLHSIVLAGTNGEAVTLTAEEKIQLIKVTREIAIEEGRPDLTIVLGCGGQSTRDVIRETKLAKTAGADFALVLVPSYFHFAMDESAILAFWKEVRKIHVL
jgi:4-hydroxy-2-oxoglutarate aldolase